MLQAHLRTVMPDTKGMTYKMHYDQIKKSIGRYPKDIPEDLEIREEVRYIWTMYNSFASPAPLSYSELRHWADFMGVEPSPMEANALVYIDRILRTPTHEYILPG